MTKQKVAILYGIGEGDYHGRAFVTALKQAGFDVVRSAEDADIVVTHSGGCFFLPPLTLDQNYVVINPPYWPGKSLVISTVQKVTIDFIDFVKDGKVLQWFWKTTINLAHIVRFLLKTLTITLHAHKQRFYEAIRDENTIIIRSARDTFLTPDADRLLEQKYGRVIPLYIVPGQHDSCWRDPAPYVEIISKIASGRVVS
jgi:hypothetical protein